MATSIFEVEKRISIKVECIRLHNFIINNEFQCAKKGIAYTTGRNLYEIFDQFYILSWKHRLTATSISHYFSYFGLDFEDLASKKIDWEDKDFLYYLEFIANLTSILLSDLDNEYTYKVGYRDPHSFEDYVLAVQNNIKTILELNNYTLYRSDKETIRISKRDAEVDTAINSINNPDIAIDLLSFLDIRNKDNLNEKKAIISRLYKHLESNVNKSYGDHIVKVNSKSKDINLKDLFTFLSNNFDIRHYPKELEKNGTLHKLDDEQTLKLLEISYRLFVRIINTGEIINDFDYVQTLKTEFALK